MPHAMRNENCITVYMDLQVLLGICQVNLNIRIFQRLLAIYMQGLLSIAISNHNNQCTIISRLRDERLLWHSRSAEYSVTAQK